MDWLGVSRREVLAWIGAGMSSALLGCSRAPIRFLRGASDDRTLEVDGERYRYYSVPDAARARSLSGVGRLPNSLKVLLEGLLRHEGEIQDVDVDDLFARIARGERGMEIPFWPTRIVLQDVLGVPALVDIAGLRDAVADAGGDAAAIKLRLPVDLVVDHSLVTRHAGTADAMALNMALEFMQNRERFEFIAWCAESLGNLRVITPGSGITHQVNLEYLASVVAVTGEAPRVACPDTLVGTDSHTTMVNGLGVLGWGVGGIEAETAMLGRPLWFRIPEVVGVHVTGALREGLLATDVVLTLTDLLRRHGVVGKFVEFFGPGLDALSLPDRATIANMAPEFGAQCAYFPIDRETTRYLGLTGRPSHQVRLVESYARAQGWWRTADTPAPSFDDVVSLDLGSVVRSIAGPSRPENWMPLSEAGETIARRLPGPRSQGRTQGERQVGRGEHSLRHGDVVIAAITSCTNTSNPSAMIAAGLLAQKAARRGLSTRPWVKTTLNPGSKVVMAYLQRANLVAPLASLGFHLAGYGCGPCVGMSGPLAPPIDAAIRERDLTCVAVLSGNRNFEGRVHPLVRASYLASPPLVVAYALAGTCDIDVTRDPLGWDTRGEPVYLRDIWPTSHEIATVSAAVVTRDLFLRNNAEILDGDDQWRQLRKQATTRFPWRPESTYIQRPPYFDDLPREPEDPRDLRGLRPLAILGDAITTDHLSPSGAISRQSAAGRYLTEHGVAASDFYSYGTRRGSHEVAMRATLANSRIRNAMAPGTEGSFTALQPEGTVMPIFDAAMAYRARGTPLVIVAGRSYGGGSSRDWAAKGVRLLGVRAVVAEGFEHTHRSNLAAMGVLPLQLVGVRVAELGLDGSEVFDVTGVDARLAPRARLEVRIRRADGTSRVVDVVARLDTSTEVEWYRHGGILPLVYREEVPELRAGRRRRAAAAS